MPDELTEELIRLRETDRDTKRQLGELAKVTGIQTKKSGVIKLIVKRVVINTRDINSSFVLGNPIACIIGTTPLGSQSSDWETHYDSGDLE
jgi:hypothetical protein